MSYKIRFRNWKSFAKHVNATFLNLEQAHNWRDCRDDITSILRRVGGKQCVKNLYLVEKNHHCVLS